MYSCAGHGMKKLAYITLKMDESTIPKIYNIIKSLHEKMIYHIDLHKKNKEKMQALPCIWLKKI